MQLVGVGPLLATPYQSYLLDGLHHVKNICNITRSQPSIHNDNPDNVIRASITISQDHKARLSQANKPKSASI